MKTDSISRLFGAFSGSAQQTTTKEQTAKVAEKPTDSGAVKLSSSFAGDGSDRGKRVAELKAQVESGSYNPDSRDVATALIRDLGI